MSIFNAAFCLWIICLSSTSVLPRLSTFLLLLAIQISMKIYLYPTWDLFGHKCPHWSLLSIIPPLLCQMCTNLCKLDWLFFAYSLYTATVTKTVKQYGERKHKQFKEIDFSAMEKPLCHSWRKKYFHIYFPELEWQKYRTIIMMYNFPFHSLWGFNPFRSMFAREIRKEEPASGFIFISYIICNAS